MAAPSRFCVFWIRNTIRKVTIVVPVLMTSCQVSEKPKNGPVTAQTIMSTTESANVRGFPVARATAPAKAVNILDHMTEPLRLPAVREHRQARQSLERARVPDRTADRSCGAGDGARTRDLRRDRPRRKFGASKDVPHSRLGEPPGHIEQVGTLIRGLPCPPQKETATSGVRARSGGREEQVQQRDHKAKGRR